MRIDKKAGRRPEKSARKNSEKNRQDGCIPPNRDLWFLRLEDSTREGGGRETPKTAKFTVLDKGKPIVRWGRKAMGS